MTSTRRGRILILAALAIGTYLPGLRLPFIDDDFREIPLALRDSSTGWGRLWQDKNLRTRATTSFLHAGLARMFGFTAPPFYAVNILIHVICVWLVYAFGVWREIVSELTAFWAACFFAISEGHQEAVMWLSAKNEMLLFLFGMAAWICWVKFLHTRSWRWYGAGIACFILSAFSKESFAIFAVLMVLPCLGAQRKSLMWLIPFFAIAALYVAWTSFSRLAQPHYADSRFSLAAPWPLVFVRSYGRLLFVWGVAALGVLGWIGRRPEWRIAAAALTWMGAAILPYSFLTYMPQIASRHSYVASAGLALLVGTAAGRLAGTGRRVLLALLCVAALAINIEIIWVKKMAQFRERAEPSELLLAAARDSDGKVTVQCTPFEEVIAESVLETAGARGVFRPAVVRDDHCFKVEYKNRTGELVRIDRRIRTGRHGVFY